MNEFISSDKEWSDVTNLVYPICERHGIAEPNVSEYCMWVRPNNVAVSEEIKKALGDYVNKKLIEVEDPHKEYGRDGKVMQINRLEKACFYL